MNKFPEDVAIAERLTGGDPHILRNDTFAPVERPGYSNIFGSDNILAHLKYYYVTHSLFNHYTAITRNLIILFPPR